MLGPPGGVDGSAMPDSVPAGVEAEDRAQELERTARDRALAGCCLADQQRVVPVPGVAQPRLCGEEELAVGQAAHDLSVDDLRGKEKEQVGLVPNRPEGDPWQDG